MTAEELIDRLLGRTTVAPDIYSADVVLLNLLVAMALAIVVAWTYRRVHRGISYSQSYVYSIVIVTMTVALAMMVIGNDITRAFALLGTFTIIRYRTAVKDPRDTAFIFIALVIGLAVGSSNYAIAIMGTLVMSLAAIVLDLIDFGAVEKLDHVLYVTGNARSMDQTAFEERMRSRFRTAKLLNINYLSDDDRVMYAYNVVLSSNTAAQGVLEDLLAVDGIEEAEILTAHNVVEF